jgi:hypothetical protein
MPSSPSRTWPSASRHPITISRRSYALTPPPVRVDCSYFITAWPSQSVTDPSQDEHRLLGELMKVLLRHPVIPEQYLRGELAGKEPPLPARIIADMQLQSLGELWQAMGGKPKAALHYAVTVGVILFGPSDAGEVVTRKIIDIGTDPTPPVPRPKER